MKITCTMSDEQFALIEPHIDADSWGNPMQDEFVFYEASERFRIILTMYNIDYYPGE